MAYEFVPDPKTNSPSALIETNTFLITDTTLYVNHVEYFPDATSDEPGIAVLGRGEDCETITYTGKTGTSGSGTLTGITREVDKETIGGVEYGTKKQWDIGDDVACVLTAYHLKKLIANATRNTPVTSTSDPTVNDDSGDGYEVGKVWINTSSDVTFICADNSSGAAVWLKVLDTSDKTGADDGIVSGTAGSDTYIGQWNGDGDLVGVEKVPIANGGTGISTAPSDGKLLIGKTDGSYTSATLTQGSNVTITNGDGTITIAASGGGGASRWTALTITTDFDDDPPSTSTITMNSDQTGNIPVGSPIKFTLGGGASNPGTYYAVVTALTSNLMTIAGAPLETDDGDLTELSYGTPEMVEQLDIAINGYYESANDTAAILNQLNMSLLWNKPKAYAVRYRVWSKVEDTSDDGKATVLINATELNTSAGGLTIAAAATWYSTVVDIATAAYDVNPGEAIEISITKGTTGDAHDLVVSIIFVYP